MNLLSRQTAFRAEIAAGDDRAPPSSLGMEIYRNAYRGRLLGALESSFERTRRWVGHEAFTAAACHYVLSHPPRGWTLDVYGADFPEMLASLFGGDPEVAELAWFEWQMQQAFAAPDRAVLEPAALAAAGYGESDWEHIRFTMAAGFAMRAVATDCMALWTALADDAVGEPAVDQVAGGMLAVWRHGLCPHFRLLDDAEAMALGSLATGATFGAIAAECDGKTLGAWLAQWLAEGIFSTASLCAQQIQAAEPRFSNRTNRC